MVSGGGDQVLSIVRAEAGGGGVRQGFWKMDVLAVTLDLGADMKSEQESTGHTQRWERVSKQWEQAGRRPGIQRDAGVWRNRNNFRERAAE